MVSNGPLRDTERWLGVFDGTFCRDEVEGSFGLSEVLKRRVLKGHCKAFLELYRSDCWVLVAALFRV